MNIKINRHGKSTEKLVHFYRMLLKYGAFLGKNGRESRGKEWIASVV